MDWINYCLDQAAEVPQRINAFFSSLFGDQNEKKEEVQVIPMSLLQNGDVVINMNQIDEGVSVTASLLQQSPVLSDQAITGGSDTEHPPRLPPAEESATNVNGAVGDQTGVGVSRTSPVGANQTVSAFNIETSRNLPLVEANAAGPGSGVPSQHSGQPNRSIVVHGIDTQALITEAKEVGNRVTILSVGGIFGELSGVIGNEHADLIHAYFFKAFMLLCYASLFAGVALHLLIKKSPTTPYFVPILKCTIYISQGTLIYAVSFAICILFPSKVGVVAILIVPLVPIAFVAILSCTPRDQTPSS